MRAKPGAQCLYAVGMVIGLPAAAAVAASKLSSAAGPPFSNASTVAICGWNGQHKMQRRSNVRL